MTAIETSPHDPGSTSLRTLADVRSGETVRVLAIEQSDDPVYQRLLHMGLIRGRRVEVVRRAPTGDPIEIRFLGYSLSLRANEARLVAIGPAE